MDSAVSTAARALSVGDPLAALKWVALRSDAPALALRGIAMAQLGELGRARALLRRAAAAFGTGEPTARARCVVAQAEVALASRDLRGGERELDAAVRLLERRGDVENALLGRLIQVRRLALLGRVEAAERTLSGLALAVAPPRLAAVAGLVAADLALKRLDATSAERALGVARRAAKSARIGALAVEVARAALQLTSPVARLARGGAVVPIRMSELPAVFATGDLVVDACRREVRCGQMLVGLVRRPLLLALLVELARAAPREVAREMLILRVFGAQRGNESHRVRLRVEVGRLRKLIVGLARLEATDTGFVLAPGGERAVSVLLPPADNEASALLALLHDGDAWATSALAAALGKSQRAVQRALAELEGEGKVRATGAGRAQRWVAAPAAGIATTLLLVAPGTLG